MNVAFQNWQRIIKHSALKFACVGVINTLLSITVIFSLKSLAGFSDIAANFAGYIVGFSFSFILNKRWTFKDSERVLQALLKFLVVFGVSYLLNIFVVLTAIQIGTNEYIAHLAGIPPYSLAFYFGCRYFAFDNKNYCAHAISTTHNENLDNQHNVNEYSGVVTQHIWAWFIGTIFFSAAILFYRLTALPIAVWDEARIANNALEMSQTGLSLITTYSGLPDHWNTKPPLLIWIMSFSINLFGANELAVRLPSVLCSLATAAILFAFCTNYLKRPFVGHLSVLFLFSTYGYVQFHAARSGDYESMLTLWTTSFILAGYLYFHGQSSKRGLWLCLCGLGVLLAFFTKTIQGLIFLPALMFYAHCQQRLLPTLKSQEGYISIIIVITAFIGYYWAREIVDPGYFRSVMANDFLGRYLDAQEGNSQGPFFYILLLRFPWTVFAFVCFAYQLRNEKSDERQVCLYLGLLSIFYLLIISSAKTKLPWYEVPISPLVAIIAAINVEKLLKWLATKNTFFKSVLSFTPWFCVLGASIVFISNAIELDRLEVKIASDEIDQYNFFVRSKTFQKHEIKKIVLIHPGYGGSSNYIGPVLFYINSLRQMGKDIVIQNPYEILPRGFDTVALCGEKIFADVAVQVKLKLLVKEKGCGLYAVGLSVDSKS